MLTQLKIKELMFKSPLKIQHWELFIENSSEALNNQRIIKIAKDL